MPEPTPFAPAPHPSLEELGQELFDLLARRFPVSCASDEFYFFPQATLTSARWHTWDRYDPETVADTVRRLNVFTAKLKEFGRQNGPRVSLDREDLIDKDLLLRTAGTLADQLEAVRGWQTQPTLYLSMACIGLAQALEDDDPEAAHQRAGTLGAFLESGRRSLKAVPALFRELGLEMAIDTRHYFQLLYPRLPELEDALGALDRFEQTLRELSCRHDFTLPVDVFEKVVRDHMDTGMTIEQVAAELDDEIAVARSQIARILADDFDGRRLEESVSAISLPEVGPAGLPELYAAEVDRLAQHCLEQKLVSRRLLSQCPVQVKPVPGYLSATRAASSYSISPGFPPAGGTFYIHGANQKGEEKQPYQREYRILSAHETWPGHHLLDINRWGHRRAVRRVVEHPCFYEGWACFAEEVMRHTGYFHTPEDRLLMARRRLWRAVRGRVDVGLQTGQMDLAEAAGCLVQTGVSPVRVRSTVRKYPLNPAYQLCYTVGLRSFERLYRRHGRQDLPRFAAVVLSAGEIGFRQLERNFRDLQR